MRVAAAKTGIAGIISSIILIVLLILSSFPSTGLDEWPAFLHDAENSGNTTSEGPSTSNILWSIPGLGGSGDDGWSSPVVSNGRVFHTQGPEGILYCLNELNGSTIWSKSIGASQYVCSTPSVVDGKVYAVGNKLYCLYASNGTEVWNKNLPGSIIGTSSPAVADGKVFVNTADICCYYASNGTLIWQRPGDGGGGESSPAYSDGRVFVNGQIGSDPYLICMYAENGTTIWNITGDWSSTSPVVDEGKVYFNVGDPNKPTVCLFASNGTEIWSNPNVGDDHASVAVAYDRVVVNDNAKIYCYYKSNGTQIWMATISSSGCSTPAISSDGKVYVNGGSNTYCLDLMTGVEIWSYTTGGAGWSSIGVANGRVFVNQGELYCFGPPLPTIDFLQIRDAPNGGGTNLCEPANYTSYPVGYITTFYAAAYNNSVGYLSDMQINAIWNTTNSSLVSVTSPGNISIITCSDTDWGTVTISMDDGNSHINTTQVTISDPDVDYIQIRDAPGGVGINLCDVVNYQVYAVGHSTIFYGAKYNSTAYYLGDVPITSSWNSSEPGIVAVASPGSFSTILCNKSSTGTVTITLDDGSGHINTTQVTVLDVNVDYIQIRDAPNGGGKNMCDPANYVSYPVGRAAVFYGAAYNETSGYVIDIPVLWVSQDSSVVSVTSSGSSTNVMCSTTNSGTVTITADDGSGHSNTTQVTVLQPTVDYIQIRSASNGGGDNLCDPVNYRSYPLEGSDTYYGARYNSTAGYLDSIPGTSGWTSSASSTVSVSSPGASTILTCSNTSYGTVAITLNDGQGNTNSTQVTVTEPSVDYVVIRDSPDGLGDVVTDTQFTLEGQVTGTYYCAAYNSSAGYIGDRPGHWDVTGGIGSVSFDNGESTDFTAEFAGTGSLIVDYMDAVSSISITVNPGAESGPPAAPTNVTCEPLGPNRILIIWSSNTESDLDEYIIERATSPQGPWGIIAFVGKEEISYIDRDVEPGTAYYYRMYAEDSDSDISSASSTFTTTTEEPEESSWFTVFIITVILIVVVLLILFFLVRKQKQRSRPREIQWSQSYPEPGTPPEEEVIFPDEEGPPPPPEDWLPPPPDDEWLPPPPPDY